MLLHCVLILLFINCINTESIYEDDWAQKDLNHRDKFSFWPSLHNAMRVLKLRRRDVQGQPGPNEGGGVDTKDAATTNIHLPIEVTNQTEVETNKASKTATLSEIGKETVVVPTVEHNDTSVNQTSVAKTEANKLNWKDPAALKRGFIVFGGFTLLAVAYFIFYRIKSSKNETANSHNSIEANQFRYGVLQSDDRQDNLDLSSVPLTVESDEDEDEDMEIFDLEQKRKSMSYVNLQANDYDTVVPPHNYETDRGNLLLDIEDATSDPLINWSSNGSKKPIL